MCYELKSNTCFCSVTIHTIECGWAGGGDDNHRTMVAVGDLWKIESEWIYCDNFLIFLMQYMIFYSFGLLIIQFRQYIYIYDISCLIKCLNYNCSNSLEFILSIARTIQVDRLVKPNEIVSLKQGIKYSQTERQCYIRNIYLVPKLVQFSSVIVSLFNWIRKKLYEVAHADFFVRSWKKVIRI